MWSLVWSWFVIKLHPHSTLVANTPKKEVIDQRKYTLKRNKRYPTNILERKLLLVQPNQTNN